MTYIQFANQAILKYYEFQRDIEIFWGNYKLKDLTVVMPFKEYSELILDCRNQPCFIINTPPSVGIIKHFVINGINVHIVEGDKVEWGMGLPKGGQKFFEALNFEPLAHQKDKEPIIPGDAYNLELFHIKENKAFLGFKMANGNFEYICVPYNPAPDKLNEAKVIQMQTLPSRA